MLLGSLMYCYKADLFQAFVYPICVVNIFDRTKAQVDQNLININSFCSGRSLNLKSF